MNLEKLELNSDNEEFNRLRRWLHVVGEKREFSRGKTDEDWLGFLEVLSVISGYRKKPDKELQQRTEELKNQVIADSNGEFDPVKLYDIMFEK